MKVYRNIQDFNPTKKVVLTPGTFDGIHFGHQKILSRLKDIAKSEEFETVVLTFSPHPRKVLFPDGAPLKLISSLDEKIIQLEKNDIDHLIIYPFTKDFSRISPLEYVRDFLIKELKINKLVIGYDHQFGKNREGNFEYLKELSEIYDFNVEEIPAQDINDVNVSSTKIRKAILNGKMELANTYLGYNFTLSGKVVKGKQLGATINFPTANILIGDVDKIIPKEGVYAVYILINHTKHKGMLSIGTNPTVSKNNKVSIEVNIFDFNEDIYGKHISIQLISRLRGSFKFDGITELKDQLKKDKIQSLSIL